MKNRVKRLILEHLQELDDDDVVAINNHIAGTDGSLEYVEENGEDFFECFYHGRLDELARAISYGDYEYDAPYIRINAYGNLFTCLCPVDEGWISLEEIADWLLDTSNDHKERVYILEKYDLLSREAA